MGRMTVDGQERIYFDITQVAERKLPTDDGPPASFQHCQAWITGLPVYTDQRGHYVVVEQRALSAADIADMVAKISALMEGVSDG